MDKIKEIFDWTIFTVGGTSTSLGAFLSAVGVIIVGVWAAGIANKTLSALHLRRGKHSDFASTIGSIAKVVILVVTFNVAFSLLGVQISTLFAATGVFALGAGFAAKNIVQNFISGSMLRLDKSIRPNDVIIIDGRWMVIQRVGLRNVYAESYVGEEILIPNSTVTQSIVTNLTKKDRLFRLECSIDVPYEADLDLVLQTLQQTIESLDWRSRSQPAQALLSDLCESNAKFEVSLWVDDVDESLTRKSDLLEAIWRALKKEKIAAAYPHVNLNVGKSE